MDKYLKNSRIILVIILFSGILNSESFALTGDDYLRRHFYGSYIGLDLGVINQFEGSVLIGYRIIPRLHAGLGGKYQYYYSRLGGVSSAHIFGPMVFTDLIAIKDLDDFLPFRFIDGAFFIHAEMNLFSLPERHFGINSEHPDKKRFFRPTWLTGAGLKRQGVANRYFHVLLMFDISSHSNKVYSNTVLRFGFMF